MCGVRGRRWTVSHRPRAEVTFGSCGVTSPSTSVFQSEAARSRSSFVFCCCINQTSPFLPLKVSWCRVPLWDVVAQRLLRANQVWWHRLLRELRRRQLRKRLPSQMDLPGQRGCSEKAAQDWKWGRSHNCPGLSCPFLIVCGVITLIAPPPFRGIRWLLGPSLIARSHSFKRAVKETSLSGERMCFEFLKSFSKLGLIVFKQKKTLESFNGNYITLVGLIGNSENYSLCFSQECERSQIYSASLKCWRDVVLSHWSNCSFNDSVWLQWNELDMSAFLCIDSNDPHVTLTYAVFKRASVFVSRWKWYAITPHGKNMALIFGTKVRILTLFTGIDRLL